MIRHTDKKERRAEKMAKKDLTMDIVQAQLKVDMDRKIIDYL